MVAAKLLDTKKIYGAALADFQIYRRNREFSVITHLLKPQATDGGIYMLVKDV